MHSSELDVVDLFLPLLRLLLLVRKRPLAIGALGVVLATAVLATAVAEGRTAAVSSRSGQLPGTTAVAACAIVQWLPSVLVAPSDHHLHSQSPLAELLQS